MDEGSLLFDEMCGRGLVPNGVTFTTLIDGQCKGGKVDLALKNFQMMLAQGVRPDLVTYNALINGLCKVTNFVIRSSLCYKKNCTTCGYSLLNSVEKKIKSTTAVVIKFPCFPWNLFLFVGSEIVLCYFPFVGVQNFVSSLVIVILDHRLLILVRTLS